MKISIRETKKGDWLIFEAIPNTLGVGIKKVAEASLGYKTGHQYHKLPTKSEAEAYAQGLAKGLDAEIVDWQHSSSNQQFEDLPRLRPTQTEYENIEQAEKDGWVRINPSKTITWYRDVKIWCEDISPIGEFGYNLGIVGHGLLYAESSEIWYGGKFSVRFRSGDIVFAIEAAKRYIDADLITQAAAANIGAPSVQAVHNAVRDGRLKGYHNPGSQGQRQGRTLVSRQEVKGLWTKS